MAIETKSIDLGNYNYSVIQLDGVRGRKAFVRLFNAIGPAFQGLTSGPEGVAKLVSNLSSGMLKEADMDHFCDLFGELTTVTGEDCGENGVTLTKNRFMTHFAGNYLEMIEWLVFCVNVNFSSFFDGVKTMIDEMQAKVASDAATAAKPSSLSLPTSTGTSTASASPST